MKWYSRIPVYKRMQYDPLHYNITKCQTFLKGLVDLFWNHRRIESSYVLLHDIRYHYCDYHTV